MQACCGLTFESGLPDLPPAGWGFSYMDHHGGNFMALAVLAALVHRNRTGEGQWVDMSCTDAGATLLGPAVLDYTVNDRPLRRDGMPHSNHSQSPAMAPHDIYPARGDDCWVAIACRDDRDWRALASRDRRGVGATTRATRRATAGSQHEAELDAHDGRVDARARTSSRSQERLLAVGRPGAAVQTPGGADRPRPGDRRRGGCGPR